MTTLRLRPLRPADEVAARAVHREMRGEFNFLLGDDPAMDWNVYLKMLEDQRRGENLPPGLVPATFLVAEVDGQIVGRSSIRHELNESLARVGGHIGYAVVPAHRRKGCATEILRQSLLVASSLGVDEALLTCDVGNAASAKVIEACGGRYESTIDVGDGEPPKHRYWITPGTPLTPR
ncbi:GNAT family N-acetyltransferase [Saccharopolyspora griseoalba]|uniref:GNAT family N-acetyltransferase n=1 Tax=Saccharopolyspora griseoalba TaxID=1431848 RepID=A0ABW2LNL2_9PSEU